MMRPLDLEMLHLDAGSHKPDSVMCVMEAVAYVAGEPWSDSPTCVSPAIAAFLRSWNDGLSDADRQRLKPYITRVIGTRTTDADEETRAWLATDWLVRVNLPAWLDLAGLTARATELRTLPPLTSSEIAVAVQATIAAARREADAAWDATWAAARAATRAAASDATRAAASDAARDAAWAAAWAATRAAAREKLRPTVTALQTSAFDLLDRMIAVGTPEPSHAG